MISNTWSKIEIKDCNNGSRDNSNSDSDVSLVHFITAIPIVWKHKLQTIASTFLRYDISLCNKSVSCLGLKTVHLVKPFIFALLSFLVVFAQQICGNSHSQLRCVAARSCRNCYEGGAVTESPPTSYWRRTDRTRMNPSKFVVVVVVVPVYRIHFRKFFRRFGTKGRQSRQVF